MNLMSSSAPVRAALLLGALALSACSEGGGPVATEPAAGPGPVELQRLECTGSTASATVTVTCGPAGAGAGGAAGALLVGGQGTYVQLTSSNVSYDAGTQILQFDVTVGNLIPQTMGTADGTTPAPEGVRVFFASGPTVTGGSGTADVANEDGTATFTASDQPYFQYSGAQLGADGLLSQNETSLAKPWQLSIPPDVTFSFTLLVAADVRFPDGYVDVTPGVDTVTAGGAQAFTGVVRSAVGNALGGAITWETSDAAVATVDAAGNVTAVAPGTVTITATSGARTGSAKLAVCPSLAVGGVYTAVMPAASGLCFGGGETGTAEYTYMPVNLSSTSVLSLGVTGRGISAVSGPPSPNLLPGTGGALLDGAAAAQAEDAQHLAMLERDRAEALRVMRSGAPWKVERTRRAGGPNYLITPGVPAVGDLWSLNVASGCSGTPSFRAARVRAVGQKIVIVEDTLNPAGGLSTAQYDSIAAKFDTLVWAVDTAAFGAPTDLDNNQRVVAFYTRSVNELSPPGSGSVVLGYVTARDLFSSAATSCPKSNEGEIFYMLAADPTGAAGNVRTTSYIMQNTVGTLAHEFQHLINFSRRLYRVPTNTFEEVWLNEGLSHIAEELMFYRLSGLSPRSNVGLSTITASNARIAAYNEYMSQNISRLRSWLSRPDTAGPVKTNDALATRGAIWFFLRYAADRADGDDGAMWYNLVNTSNAGVANLQAVLGSGMNDWIRDFSAAAYTDDAVAGVAPEYTITSWNLRSLYSGIGTRVYPLLARPLADGAATTLSFSRGGSTSYFRFGVPTGQFAGLTALSGGVAPTSPYALIVVRTK